MFKELFHIKTKTIIKLGLFKELFFIIQTMIKKEMIDNFGFDRKTLNNWENSEKPQRKLLYEVLKRLPLSFVEETKMLIENEKKLQESLK